MRSLFAIAALALIVSACDRKQPEGSEIERLDTYTAKDSPQQSRAQIRFYAETEGKMRPIEKEAATMRERMRSGLQVSPEKTAALEALEAAIPPTRAKITALRAASVSSAEAMQPDIEAAVTNLEKLQKTLVETP